MSAEQIHNILERLCVLLRAEMRAQGAADGLLPVQLEALHYLSQSNRYSDTVQGLTEFLGQTKGTVSQTVKVLESRGLVSKRPDARDRRVVHLAVSVAGRRLLERAFPAPSMTAALKYRDDERTEELTDSLRGLLQDIQKATHAKPFAPCKSCRFNERAEEQFRCGLTGEMLSEDDTRHICREHQYP